MSLRFQSSQEVCDLPGTETKPIAEQTGEPGHKAPRGWQVSTGLQQQFELTVVENILVRVACNQCLSVPVSPFVFRRLVVSNSVRTGSVEKCFFLSARQ